MSQVKALGFGRGVASYTIPGVIAPEKDDLLPRWEGRAGNDILQGIRSMAYKEFGLKSWLLVHGVEILQFLLTWY